MKRLLAAAVAALAGGFVGALIATMATPQRQDAADAYLAANRAEVERMVYSQTALPVR